MEPLNQRKSFEIERTNVIETLFAFGRLYRLCNGFHVQRPLLVLSSLRRALCPRLVHDNTGRLLKSA
jgi:hypothetical protein